MRPVQIPSRVAVIALTFLVGVISVNIAAVISRNLAVDDSRAPAPGTERQSITTTDFLTPLVPALTSTTPDKQTVVPDLSGINSSSPYELFYYISANPKFDANILWQRLGILGDSQFGSSWDKNVSFFSTCSYCKAQLDETNAGNFGDTLLLRIENAGTEETRYLLFKRKAIPGSFRLIGFIDHDFGRYQMPTHRWVESGGRTFLVVRVQTASGSGVAMYVDRLFTIRNNRLIEVLEYPGEGHSWSTCADPGMDFYGKITDISDSGSDLLVNVSLAVRYTGCDEVVRTTNTRHLIFSWSKKTGRATLDTKSSKLTKRESEILKDLSGLFWLN